MQYSNINSTVLAVQVIWVYNLISAKKVTATVACRSVLLRSSSSGAGTKQPLPWVQWQMYDKIRIPQGAFLKPGKPHSRKIAQECVVCMSSLLVARWTLESKGKNHLVLSRRTDRQLRDGHCFAWDLKKGSWGSAQSWIQKYILRSCRRGQPLCKISYMRMRSRHKDADLLNMVYGFDYMMGDVGQ